MNVASIHRWQWMVLGLLAGAIYGYAREASADFAQELASYSARRIGQREFEQSLARKIQGRPCLTDLVVTPHRLPGTRQQTITLHVVSGLYCDGRTQMEDGRRAIRWEPAYFVASVPYRPVAAPAGTTGSAEFENVAAYLGSLSLPEPVSFQYARWWWVARPQVVWTTAGFMLIGVVWPTIVNLLAFGTFYRPREARGILLWNAKAAPSPSQKKPEVAPDDTALAALEQTLEASLSDVTPAPPPAASKPQIRALGTAETVTAAAILADEKKKDFGAEKEDFYPTELRARHDK